MSKRQICQPLSAAGAAVTYVALLATAVGFAPLAAADPTLGHVTDVSTTSPAMLCALGSDDDAPGVGPNVVCQSDGFPQSPVELQGGYHSDQAVVTAAGQFSYRVANIPTGGDDFHPEALANGKTYHRQGWTVVQASGGVVFVNDGTGHGMAIAANGNVTPF